MINRFRGNLKANVKQIRQKGSFAQNLAITFSATAFVAVLGFAVSPIMTRLYNPQSYGLFALFTAIVNNVNLISTLGYAPAFVLPRQRKRSIALVQLTVLLSLAALLLMSLAFWLIHDKLLRWLRAEELGVWFYVIPLAVFVFNLNVLMSAWYLRTKDFKKRAGIDVVTAVAGRSITLAVGWLGHGPAGGLLLGDLFSKFTMFFSMLFNGIHRQLGELRRPFSWSLIRAVAWEYREYPFYVMPTAYLNTLAGQLPIFFLATGFGTTAVGLFAFSTSLLELPINLIGNAVAPVFLQKAAETYQQDPERLKQICLNLYNKLFYLGLLPFGVITVFGDWIFSFVFGARWEQAGVFTGYLGYYYVFKLASYATSPIYAVLQRQRIALLGTALLVLARAGSLVLGMRLHNLNLGMLLFGLSSLIVTFLVDLNVLYLLHVPMLRVAMRTLLFVVITLGLLWGLRASLEGFLAGSFVRVASTARI
ncbi:oligosaccharide flippase family protein [Hymenobacter sp. YC55]|uniref:lipopolysaccharide biosynthesis protein n=1 Tax=Hymenobacter sp. YC55 TaxID=3034019 RepID=UPI0023F7A4FD|nr:oligosaccharide flippase family protein [Hymenobacter sp. YC55]MDF7810197.1 oligosaccharide flippase family protein [Hymenobacter sp. YC55]